MSTITKSGAKAQEPIQELTNILGKYGYSDILAERYLPFLKSGVSPADIGRSIEAYVNHKGMKETIAVHALPMILESLNSPTHAKLIPGFIEAYCAHVPVDNYHGSRYLQNALPELFKGFKSDKDAEAALGLVKDYAKRFGEPYGYAFHILPAFFQKAKSIDEVKLWDAEFKKIVERYHSSHGKPDEFVDDHLSSIVAAATQPWQLRMAGQIAENFAYDAELMGRIPPILYILGRTESLKKWGPAIAPLIVANRPAERDYAEFHVPRLLENVKSEAQLKEVTGIVQHYLKNVPYHNYRYTSLVGNALPKVFALAHSDSEMKAAAKALNDYIDRFGEPYDYAQEILPVLIRKAGFKDLESLDAEAKRLIANKLQGKKERLGESAAQGIADSLR